MDSQKVVTEIDESLTDLSGDKVETVIKELLSDKKLPYITELTFEQVVEICKLKHLAKKYGNVNFPRLNKKYPIEDTINEFIKTFTLYMCSHKRKRVGEFLDGLKTDRENKQQTPNFFSKVLNK